MSITICDTRLTRTVRYLSLTFEPVYSGRYNVYPKIVDITVNVAASTTAVVVTSFNTNVTVYWFVFESKEQVIFDTSLCSNPEFASTALIACC